MFYEEGQERKYVLASIWWTVSTTSTWKKDGWGRICMTYPNSKERLQWDWKKTNFDLSSAHKSLNTWNTTKIEKTNVVVIVQ